VGLAVIGKSPWRYVPAYLVFQLIGAIVGAGATWATFGEPGRDVAVLGATVPATGVGLGQVFIVEALITFLLVFVIVSVATDPRVPAAVAAPSIGFAQDNRPVTGPDRNHTPPQRRATAASYN